MDESDIVQNALAKSEEDGIEIEEVTDEVERQPSSALEENIMNKGKNAYYYAHAGNLGKGADKKNLGGAPRLLTRTESKKDDSVKSRRENNITDYSWADSDKKVSIYITSLENLGSMDPETSGPGDGPPLSVGVCFPRRSDRSDRFYNAREDRIQRARGIDRDGRRIAERHRECGRP